MIVNVPVSQGSREAASKINIRNQQTSITGDIQTISSETIVTMMNLTEMRKDKQLRNAKKSMEAMIMNQMAEYIFMKDPYVQFELTKRRPTQKSIKLFKYKRIDPFNEEGLRVFGERMVEIIRNTLTVSLSILTQQLSSSKKFTI